MSGTTQGGVALEPHSQPLRQASRSGSVSCLILGLVALGCCASGANAATPSSPPLEVITLSDKGLLPPESSDDKSPASKPASSLSSGLRVGSVSKDVHKEADAPRADSPFPAKKAPAPAPASAAPVSSPPAASASQPTTYLVKSGDTLDKVVQKALGDSPLKSDILKREIVALNPDAFSKGSQKILKSGVYLKLPNNDDLLRSQLGLGQSSSQQGSRKQFVGYETYPDVIINPQGMEKRKSWVQFP